MKTKILPDNSYCVGEVVKGSISVGHCTLEDCYLEDDLKRAIGETDVPCLTTQVEDGEPFFFSLSMRYGAQHLYSGSYIGHFEPADDGKTLVPDEKVAGDAVSLIDGDHFLIHSYQPTDLFFLADHSCCVLTSDSMISLEKDTYLGYKEGHIDSLSADELLEQLGRYETGRSPNYQRVHLSPLTQRPSKPVEGTLISNKISNCLEYFDGKNWRKIKLEEPEG